MFFILYKFDKVFFYFLGYYAAEGETGYLDDSIRQNLCLLMSQHNIPASSSLRIPVPQDYRYNNSNSRITWPEMYENSENSPLLLPSGSVSSTKARALLDSH